MEIRDDGEKDLVHYMEVADPYGQYKFACFAVYDMGKLEVRYELNDDGQLIEMLHPYYQFKFPNRKREALVAVVKVTDFW